MEKFLRVLLAGVAGGTLTACSEAANPFHDEKTKKRQALIFAAIAAGAQVVTEALAAKFGRESNE